MFCTWAYSNAAHAAAEFPASSRIRCRLLLWNMSCCLQLLGECGITLLWRSRKRNAAPFKAQGRSLALSDNCSQWSPTCNICWSNKIWQGWNCLEMYWLALKLLSFSSWRRKRVFTDKMEEVGFYKEGCHCNLLFLLHCHGDWWMSWAPLS